MRNIKNKPQPPALVCGCRGKIIGDMMKINLEEHLEKFEHYECPTCSTQSRLKTLCQNRAWYRCPACHVLFRVTVTAAGGQMFCSVVTLDRDKYKEAKEREAADDTLLKWYLAWFHKGLKKIKSPWLPKSTTPNPA